MTPKITGISSMATRQVLVDLCAAFGQRSGIEVAMAAVGGVDAAKRVRGGEPFDVVVLASYPIDELITAGRVLAGSKVDLVRSGVAIAVRAGAPRPDIGSEDTLRRAVLAARSVGYSTGPSGVQLAQLFERWGIAGEIKDRIVQASPGVPVGALVRSFSSVTRSARDPCSAGARPKMSPVRIDTPAVKAITRPSNARSTAPG